MEPYLFLSSFRVPPLFSLGMLDILSNTIEPYLSWLPRLGVSDLFFDVVDSYLPQLRSLGVPSSSSEAIEPHRYALTIILAFTGLAGLLLLNAWRARAGSRQVTPKPPADEPVLLSYYIKHGEFRHWVLHTHSHKYELRRIGTGYRPLIQKSRHVGVELALRTQSFQNGRYYYCFLGWTTKTKEEVDESCNRVAKSFGVYSLAVNNCQDFLISLAADVITREAADWQLFQVHKAAPALKAAVPAFNVMSGPMMMGTIQYFMVVMMGKLKRQKRLQSRRRGISST